MSSYSQLYKKHQWDPIPQQYKLIESDQQLASVAIKEKYLIQYYQKAIGGYQLFETKHSIIKVNNEKGIKRHNRVYIPTHNVVRVIDIKARVIAPDGSVQKLDKTNIKELKNVEGYGSFKIFAIEGVTKNSQLEFIYTLEKKISGVGSIVVQKDYKVQKAEVILRKPKSLQLDFKPYNKFPNLEKTKVLGDKDAFTTTISDISAMIQEKSATPDANRMKICYSVKGSYNYLGSWNTLANSIKTRFINIPKRKGKRNVIEFEKYIEKNHSKHIINTICEYVTKNYSIVRSNEPIYTDLRYIVPKKQATQQGIIKVYTSLLNHYNLPYKLVLTSNRYKHKFDQEFYSDFNLQQLLIFFPDQQKYLLPSNKNTRLSYAPSNYIANRGFFIDKQGNGVFDDIKVPSADFTITKRHLKINFDDNLIPHVECSQKLTGYKANNQRGAYKYYVKNELDKFKKIFIASGIEDVEYESFELKNQGLSHITDNTPFEMNWSYTAQSLYEEAGNDLILNIGKVIGTQAEFYQEVKRINPIELAFPNKYTYFFEVQIPEGYEPQGLEIFGVDQKAVSANGDKLCVFYSDYEIVGDKIMLEITEDYYTIQMDLQHYEDYKNVVNAAFDFTNKSIIFVKK